MKCHNSLCSVDIHFEDEPKVCTTFFGVFWEPHYVAWAGVELIISCLYFASGEIIEDYHHAWLIQHYLKGWECNMGYQCSVCIVITHTLLNRNSRYTPRRKGPFYFLLWTAWDIIAGCIMIVVTLASDPRGTVLTVFLWWLFLSMVHRMIVFRRWHGFPHEWLWHPMDAQIFVFFILCFI